MYFYLFCLRFVGLFESVDLVDFIVAVQSLSCVWLFETPWITAGQASLSFTISWSLLQFMSIPLMMPSNLCRPLSSYLQSFLASGSFPRSWLFASGGQSIGASASVLTVNIQGWFPLGLTGLISLLSKGLSRVFSRYVVGDGQPKEGQRGKHCKSLKIRKGYITSPRYWYKSIHLNNC